MTNNLEICLDPGGSMSRDQIPDDEMRTVIRRPKKTV